MIVGVLLGSDIIDAVFVITGAASDQSILVAVGSEDGDERGLIERLSLGKEGLGILDDEGFSVSYRGWPAQVLFRIRKEGVCERLLSVFCLRG